MTLTIHRARWIMVEPGQWLENGWVAVKDHRIHNVSRGSVSPSADRRIIDHGDGILMPSLVNAHTHITLSGSARPQAVKGFIPWVQALISERNRQNPEEAARTVQDGARVLKNTGTGLVGEFGPHIPVAMVLKTLRIHATVWLECLGNDRDLPSLPEDTPTINHAHGGHAPHTTSPTLLKRIQRADARLERRFCLHLAESPAEMEFLQKGKGAWADFMTHMGIDFSNWNCFGKRPVEMALDMGLLDQNTLAVHLLEINAKEMENFAQTGAHACLCPRSNWMLHHQLPDIEGFLKLGIQPALGTDSLASVTTLSLFDEMRFIHDRFPKVSPDVLLGMGTRNGARALGYPDLGTLRPGHRSPMVYVDLNVNNSKQAAEALVSTDNLMVRPIF
ncbi:MAG: amidohydrolase family protein [Deltaproteobacteria bacterium]|nr:amidohydrolase family protein [Deltaproteobacteria bacterium]